MKSRKSPQHNLTLSIPLSDFDFAEDAVTKTLDKINLIKTPSLDCIAPSVLKRQIFRSANLLQYFSMNLLIWKSPRHLEISKCYPYIKKKERWITIG